MECSWFATWFAGVNWIEVFRIWKDLLVGLGWPASIIFLGWLFRREIRRKFKDLISAGPTGMTFRAQQDRHEPADLRSVALENLSHRPTVKSVAEDIFNNVDKIDGPEQVPVLVNQLALARLGRHFEEIYSVIFGSQVEGLKDLASADGVASLAQAEQFFETVKAKDQEFYSKITFSEWFQYLKTMDLAVIEGESVRLTDKGREFVMFVDEVKANQRPRSF